MGAKAVPSGPPTNQRERHTFLVASIVIPLQCHPTPPVLLTFLPSLPSLPPCDISQPCGHSRLEPKKRTTELIKICIKTKPLKPKAHMFLRGGGVRRKPLCNCPALPLRT